MTTRPSLILHAALACWFVAAAAVAGEFTGKVVGITDGDTVKVRLNGIHCPLEKGQAFGLRAKHFA